MRLYAVITPPPSVLHDLRRAVDEARKHTPDVPWTEPSMWSLMLARFGNLGLHEATVVRQTLDEIGTYCPPLTLQLTGAAATPQDSDIVDSVGVGMAGDVTELWSLAKAIPAMVQRHGMFLDRRSFQAVVTLAQGAQVPFPARQAVAALESYVGPSWTATEMRLVRLIPRTNDEPGLGDYEDVARYGFTAAADSDTDAYAGVHKAR